MINSKKPSSYQFAPPGPTNYDEATTFVYSLAPRSLAFDGIPTHRHISGKKGVSQILPRVSDVVFNFSNNISMPRVGVNIKKIKHDTTFEIF